MSPQLREFVFSVDTEEVLGADPPPVPVFAAPRRRAPSPPTVALRLPDLSVAAAPEGPTAIGSPTAISFELPAVRQALPEPSAALTPVPIVSLPTMPAVESANAAGSPGALESAVAAQSAPVAAKTESPQPGTAMLTAAPDSEAFWKNPKFMLAGVAAAFLGMVSLMAMNHEATPVGDEAPAWNGMNATASAESKYLPTSSQSTPRVIRGDDPGPGVPDDRFGRFASELPPTERTASTPRETRYSGRPAVSVSSHANQQGPWVDSATGTERIAFGDETEGTARLVEPLPNFASPVEREVGQESTQADGSFR